MKKMGDKSSMVKQSPIKHFFIISGGTFLNLIIGILTTPIITRIVNPEEYGMFSIFNLYANIAVMVFCVGLDQGLVRFYYKYDDISYKKKLINQCVSIPICVCIIVSIILFPLIKSGIIKFEFSTEIYYILVICVIFQLVYRISVLVIRLEYHSTSYSLIHIAYKILYAGLIILLVKMFAGNDLLMMAIAITSAYLICSALCVFCERRVWLSKSNDSKFTIDRKSLLLYGFPFILSMGITTVFQGIDKMSLNHFCSYSEVGIYSSAMSLVHVFAILQSSFNALWAPMATEHYEKNREDKSFYIKGNSYITLLMFGAGICLIFAKDIFAILLGAKYREAAYILPCLCFNPIMYTISETTVSGINFAKKSHLHIWVAAISCVVNIIGNTILVPIIGGKGAAISTGFSYVVFFALRTVFSNKYFPIKFKLGRLIIVTIVTFIYALYNTFFAFNMLTVVFFLLCLVVLLGLYRNEVVDCFNIAKAKLSSIILRKS